MIRRWLIQYAFWVVALLPVMLGIMYYVWRRKDKKSVAQLVAQIGTLESKLTTQLQSADERIRLVESQHEERWTSVMSEIKAVQANLTSFQVELRGAIPGRGRRKTDPLEEQP